MLTGDLIESGFALRPVDSCLGILTTKILEEWKAEWSKKKHIFLSDVIGTHAVLQICMASKGKVDL